MKTLFSSSNLISHPGKSLADHLSNVGNISKGILLSKKWNIENYLDIKTLQDVVYIIGVIHDIGKSTSFFQNYIREEDELKRMSMKNNPETHHSYLSSLFTYYTIKVYLEQKNLLGKKFHNYLPIIGFLIVKRHHGNLHNADDEVIDFNKKNDEILEKQINSINFVSINKILNSLFSNIDLNIDYELIKDKLLRMEEVNYYNIQDFSRGYIYDFQREKKLIRNIDTESTLFYYFLSVILFSILLDADKTDASGIPQVERIDLDARIVDKYKKIKFKNQKKKNMKINEIRNNIYKEVMLKVDNIDIENDRFFSLNVPTGTGKTLTALSFALKLKRRIEKEKKFKSRIIYSLPFLSIIDQNHAVFEDIFMNVNKKEPTTDMLLKHHHLSDVVYTTKDNDYENLEKSIGDDLLQVEGWNSEIVVTTFIQFFHSLISNRNRSIRKVHNITNSIVILDEIQAIHHKYWLLLNNALKFFAEFFNTYFLLITATQPLLFDETKKEITSLINEENRTTYFNSMDRLELLVNTDPIFIKDLKEIIKKDIIQETRDILIVLNTIRSSKEIYDFIREMNLKDTELFYLSTNIIPFERMKRIRKINKESNSRKIIVSTQLIEAGVDIDAGIVYRDFAPLDSINQVSGRCNRNYGQEKGLVKLYMIKDENNNKEFYRYIYGQFITSKTMDVLKETGKNKIREGEFLKLNQKYFEKVNISKSDDESIAILRNVECLKFDDLSKFRLIEKIYPKIDVFIEVDDEANDIWQKYEQIKSIQNLLVRKNEFLKIKRKFYEYVISIPEKYATALDNENQEIGYVPKNEIELYYDSGTGFKRDSAGSGALIC